jgi:nucleoside-diphosphate-sugar epimerase
MKLLITGASGFVGGALWRAARHQGYQTIALGRRPVAAPDYVQRDLTQPLELPESPDAVVHAAALSSPWGSRCEYERNNVTATRHVVRYCEAHGCPRLLLVSSTAVMYVNAHQFGLTEETPLPDRAINTYAATKRAAEEIVQGYRGPWCILRPRAVFGPGDTVLFPRILRAAKAGRLPLIEAQPPVVGDMIFIDTLVDYLLRALERGATGTYLLTNHEPVPTLEFLGTVMTQLGLAVPSRRVPVARAMRAAAVLEAIYTMLPFLGEPPATRFGVSAFAYSKTFNVARALRDLGPPSTTMAEGVERFVAWQKGQPGWSAAP